MKKERDCLVRIVPVRSPASKRLLETMAALGMGVEHVGAGRIGSAVRAVLRSARTPGSVALVSGPSGGGKSTLMRVVHGHLLASGGSCIVVEASACGASVGSLLDGWGDSAEHAAECLSAAGLGDATLWARAPSELSEGERARLSVARAWAALTQGGRGGGVLLWDECVSVLDRTTARSVCASLARLVRRSGVSIVCATAHDDVCGWLLPDAHVWCGLGEEAAVLREVPRQPGEHEKSGGVE